MYSRTCETQNLSHLPVDTSNDFSKDFDPQPNYVKPQPSFFATPERKTKSKPIFKTNFLSTSPFASPSPFNHPYSASPNRSVVSDRFIPVRSGPLSKNLFEMSEEFCSPNGKIEPFSEEVQHQLKYTSLLENQLLNLKHNNLPSTSRKSDARSSFSLATPEAKGHSSQSRFLKPKLLKFKAEAKEDKHAMSNITLSPFMELEDEEESIKETMKPFRKISKTPYKILDAPGLIDDYYVDLLHWSQKNYLAVSLIHSVWVLNVGNDNVNKLYEASNPLGEITSVQWDDKGNVLALGDNEGNLNLWDFEASRKIRTIEGHSDRINCISWNGSNIISTASRDSMIYTRDLRAPNDYVVKYAGHKDEVCGLKWSPSGQFLASGGNDNKVFVWSLQKTEPEMRFDQHTSAVKAIAWSPHKQELLLTGGGYTDRRINMWNVLSANLINSVETESQVCNILFSKNSNEFVTTHGHPKNQVVVWNYPDLNKLCVLDSTQSHSQRILFLSDSPNGENIVTGASDETLKFWNVFEKKPSKAGSFLFPSSWDLR